MTLLIVGEQLKSKKKSSGEIGGDVVTALREADRRVSEALNRRTENSKKKEKERATNERKHDDDASK